MTIVSWCLTKCMIWMEEERYFAKVVQLRLQGNWTRWCNYIQNELSWKHLLVTSPRLTSFVLGATFDTLPSPTNLRRWHITTEADCSLCHCVLSRFAPPLMFSLAAKMLSVRVDILSVTIRY